jgi:hypothetical protein
MSNLAVNATQAGQAKYALMYHSRAIEVGESKISSNPQQSMSKSYQKSLYKDQGLPKREVDLYEPLRR